MIEETKQEKRQRKLAEAAKRNLAWSANVVDCACLIHDTLYDWCYVEKLYNSLRRHLTPQVRLHVYTEKNRAVPDHMIHHPLQEWPGIRGPKQSWWYKIQLFNAQYHQVPMIYFDLDTVITGNIDWIWQLPTDQFWAVQDFKYLFRNRNPAINSSVMWFNPAQWNHVYQEFDPDIVAKTRGRWHGDQDYIQEKIPLEKCRYFPTNQVASWRWELHDGGYDFLKRKHRTPGTGTVIPDTTSIAIFHGHPKPHEICDSTVLQHWQ
jgi:hypothetical protein